VNFFNQMLDVFGLSMWSNIPHIGPKLAKANGIDIAYEIFGFDHSTPILLIMGFGQPMSGWDDEFCYRLAAQNYRVIRFDNRDMGRSTKINQFEIPTLSQILQLGMTGISLSTPYTLDDMMKDSVGLLDALDIPAAHVVGASMGGMIGQLMAIYHPARVLTLTSIMSTTGEPGLPPPSPEVLQALLMPAPKERNAFIKHFAGTSRILRGQGFPKDEARDKERAVLLYDNGIPLEGASRQFVAVAVSGSRRMMLGSVKVPTLVIHGEEDRLLPVIHGHATAAAIPGAELKVIEGMGHAMPEELWPELIEAIVSHTRQ